MAGFSTLWFGNVLSTLVSPKSSLPVKVQSKVYPIWTQIRDNPPAEP